jgi:cellulose synthase/poly-beta-1,6-N-acetylglucosamine synthase-like glycosyltransferase
MFDEIDSGDVALVMDADSVLVPEFLQTAVERLEGDPDLMAVGGVFSASRAPVSSASYVRPGELEDLRREFLGRLL